MNLEPFEGKTFGEHRYRLCREKSAEFVAVTGDDPDRWIESAPPGLAAALLFVVAPDLLTDPAVEGAVVHGDQSFIWHRPLTLETDVAVSGTVDRVRERGGVSFVSFSILAVDAVGPLVEGKSTFLVGGVADPVPAVEDPSPLTRAASDPVGVDLPAARSASRQDLIRYAAATRDWNPIHWDHQSGVAAGFGGIVVHGLLQSAWLAQVAATVGEGDRPLESVRFRYTAPLRPAEPAEVTGAVDGPEFDLALVSGGSTTVTGRFRAAP